MEAFSALLPLCAGNSPVTGEFPLQRSVTRSFGVSLIYAWTNGWVINGDAGGLRRRRAYCDVIVMWRVNFILVSIYEPCPGWGHMSRIWISNSWPISQYILHQSYHEAHHGQRYRIALENIPCLFFPHHYLFCAEKRGYISQRISNVGFWRLSGKQEGPLLLIGNS